MKRLSCFLMLALLCGYTAAAKDITGIVLTKEDGKPVAGAIVYVKKANGAIVRFASTDGNGMFSLSYGAEVDDSCFMEVRMMGFKTETIRQPFPDNISLSLEAEPLDLDEVVVKAEKVEVRGDTVSYSVPTLLTNDDRVLGDVLTKIPGVDVDEKGYVRVQGKPINRFYIEGSDLLESRFNISANASYDFSQIDEQDIYDGVIMQNYKYLILGRENMETVPSFSAGGEINFQDPLSGWTLRGDAQYHRSQTFEEARFFVGDYIILQMSDVKVPYSRVTSSATIEKAFLDISGKMSFGGSFAMVNTSIRQNEVYTDYTGYNARASAAFSGNIAKWMRLKYSGEYRYNRYMVEGKWSGEASHSFNHGMTLTFFPCSYFSMPVTCSIRSPILILRSCLKFYRLEIRNEFPRIFEAVFEGG